MEEALRLEQEPQLGAVGGEAVEVLGVIDRGVGIHTDAAILFDDAGELVGLDVSLGAVDGELQLRFEERDAACVRLGAFVALGVQTPVDLFDLVQGFLFRRPVLGADGFAALEGHVLEHVRQTGLAGRIVDRAGVHVSMKRHHRSVVPLDHDEVQPVIEGELGNPLFKFLEILRVEADSRSQNRSQTDPFH